MNWADHLALVLDTWGMMDRATNRALISDLYTNTWIYPTRTDTWDMMTGQPIAEPERSQEPKHWILRLIEHVEETEEITASRDIPQLSWVCSNSWT